jgi:uncharacterized protein YndB with AHSA1/START domain
MVVTHVPSGPETLLIEADFPIVNRTVLFNAWIDPVVLQQWWPQKAETEPHIGGAYHLSWPAMNWHLRGYYSVFEPPTRLTFTWKWDNDLEGAAFREVKLHFELLAPEETRLHLTHGPYENTPEEQKIRIEQHLAGWTHFLQRLQQLLTQVR